jgi:hypothetical protein
MLGGKGRDIKQQTIIHFRSGQGPVAGFCEHGNETLGSIKKTCYCLTSLNNVSAFQRIFCTME